MKTVTGYLCGQRVYEYKGVVFEVSGYADDYRIGGGCWPIIKEVYK